MKMPHVIPDSIRNPGAKDWIEAYASMTTDFRIKTISIVFETAGAIAAAVWCVFL